MMNKLDLTFRLATLTLVMVLGGCLSSGGEESTSFNGASPPPPPPPPGSNTAPSISGDPSSAVVVGAQYSFTPTATDPDGDSLTFSIQNQPSWANFDSTNGSLTGIPALGDIGSYTNIRISVSDGQLSASTPNFSVDVTQVATSSTTLTWTAPTQNEDGSALTDLAGFKIFYGTSSRNYTNEIRIDNPSITTYVVENLTPDTYYFAAKAFNSADEDSQYSGELVRTVN